MTRTVLLPFCVMCLAVSVITGCGAGLSNVEEKTPELHTTIDPFDFSDEFVAVQSVKEPARIPSNRVAEPDTTHVTQEAEKRPSGETDFPGRNENGEVKPLTTETARGYRIQVGAYEEKENAEHMRDYVVKKLNLPVYLEYQPPFYRVRVGDFQDIREAEQYVEILRNNGFKDARWVPSTIMLQQQ